MKTGIGQSKYCILQRFSPCLISPCGSLFDFNSAVKVFIYYNKTLSGRLRQLKNKRKVQLGNPKSGRGRLRVRGFHYKV